MTQPSRLRPRVGSVILLLLVGATAFGCSSPSTTAFTIDHPPIGAFHSLVEYATCMRNHGVQVSNPIAWHGHLNRLTIEYPVQTSSTEGAFAACDHLKVQAKVRGGQH